LSWSPSDFRLIGGALVGAEMEAGTVDQKDVIAFLQRLGSD
jgi:hypothetical protein